MKKKRIFDQISVFWRSNFCIFQGFHFLTSRWFSQQLKLLCSVGFWCVFLQFCQVFLLWKKTYFWSDFCILKVKFLHISDLLFSYKQMVFPAIKAPLLRRILMRIFAVLQVFLLWKKNVFLIRFLYFEGLHISDLLFSYKQMVFPAIKAPLLRRILMRIFAVLPGFFAVFWRSNFRIFQGFHISDLLLCRSFLQGQMHISDLLLFTSTWFSQQLKLLCSVGFWCVFLQFCQVFCCEKKTYFWSHFCILKVKFLQISDFIFLQADGFASN